MHACNLSGTPNMVPKMAPGLRQMACPNLMAGQLTIRRKVIPTASRRTVRKRQKSPKLGVAYCAIQAITFGGDGAGTTA